MDKDIYSTLADSRPLIALIYKIYAKNTIYKKRQLYWFFIQSTSSEKWQDRNSRKYLIGIMEEWKTSVLVKQMSLHT